MKGEKGQNMTGGENDRRWMIEARAAAALLLEKSPLAAMLLIEGMIVSANARAAGMMGLTPDDLAGRHVSEIIHPDDAASLSSILSEMNPEGESGYQKILRFVKSGGNTVWGEVAVARTETEGGSGLILFAYDITEYKEAELRRREFMELARRQEEQLIHSTRLAELGEMAAAIAHELKQPLTGIRNFARNAYYMIEKDVGGPDEIKNNLRLISEQVDRAARIINQMRDLTSKSEPHFVKMDINATVRESLDFLAPQLALSEVDVKLKLAPGMPYITGDRLRLEQVFLNIITNARQAMEGREIKRLEIRSYLDRESDCPVAVEFSDSGVGFGEEDAKKLFTAFYSTKKPGQGTGLGLSISMRIIREHNGRIEAAGEPGKGARFTVRLPLPGAAEKKAGE